jgi:chemotaxis protein CheD
MLPRYEEGRDKVNAGKYVDTAIYLMVDELLEMGGKKHAFTAKIVGGSQMFNFVVTDTLDIGSRNIEAAIATLKKEGIPIIAEDVGGHVGRTIHFDLRIGKILIQTSGKVTKEI